MSNPDSIARAIYFIEGCLDAIEECSEPIGCDDMGKLIDISLRIFDLINLRKDLAA